MTWWEFMLFSECVIREIVLEVVEKDLIEGSIRKKDLKHGGKRQDQSSFFAFLKKKIIIK